MGKIADEVWRDLYEMGGAGIIVCRDPMYGCAEMEGTPLGEGGKWRAPHRIGSKPRVFSLSFFDDMSHQSFLRTQAD